MAKRVKKVKAENAPVVNVPVPAAAPVANGPGSRLSDAEVAARFPHLAKKD